MEKTINLKVFKREKMNGKAKVIRKAGYLPAVLYGANLPTRMLKVLKSEFEKVYTQAGENTLLELSIDSEKPVRVLIYDVQKEAIKDRLSHVDFFQVDMKKKVVTEIPLAFVGESKAVKEQGGSLIKNLDSIEIECLPDDLVHEIRVDISRMESLEDSLKISDIELPKGIKALADGEIIVASVVPPKVEEEPIAPVSVENVEVVGKGKEEKAEGEETKEKSSEKK
ncbi:MAG: 50S ribosomal protein L25 [Patescibacteria group bacterium]|jgi:large subunit ribosomal protein L25